MPLVSLALFPAPLAFCALPVALVATEPRGQCRRFHPPPKKYKWCRGERIFGDIADVFNPPKPMLTAPVQPVPFSSRHTSVSRGGATAVASPHATSPKKAVPVASTFSFWLRSPSGSALPRRSFGDIADAVNSAPKRRQWCRCRWRPFLPFRFS